MGVKLIFGLLLYIVTISILITITAMGLGYTIDNSSGCVYTDTTIDCTGMVTYAPPTQSTIISSIPIIGNITASAFDGASYVGSIIAAFGAVLFWTLPEVIFPLWANVLFIKIPLITLIASIVELLWI